MYGGLWREVSLFGEKSGRQRAILQIRDRTGKGMLDPHTCVQGYRRKQGQKRIHASGHMASLRGTGDAGWCYEDAFLAKTSTYPNPALSHVSLGKRKMERMKLREIPKKAFVGFAFPAFILHSSDNRIPTILWGPALACSLSRGRNKTQA